MPLQVDEGGGALLADMVSGWVVTVRTACRRQRSADRAATGCG